jgi:hypothetical protein
MYKWETPERCAAISVMVPGIAVDTKKFSSETETGSVCSELVLPYSRTSTRILTVLRSTGSICTTVCNGNYQALSEFFNLLNIQFVQGTGVFYDNKRV